MIATLTTGEEELIAFARRKERLGIFRETFTKCARLKLESLEVDLQADFEPAGEFGFSITIFNRKESGNCTFSFYSFQKTKDIRRRLDSLLKALRCDDFKVVRNLRDS